MAAESVAGRTAPPGRFEHAVFVMMCEAYHKNAARSASSVANGNKPVNPYGEWTKIGAMVGYNASALICAVLVGAMFACRMKWLVCAKTAGVKRPPLDLLAMSFFAFLVIFVSNVLGNSNELSTGRACLGAAYLSPMVHIIIKQLIYVHLATRVHTIRGCLDCSHPSGWKYRQAHRCKSDYVWLFLMIFTFISSLALMVDIGFSVRQVYNIDDLSCSIGLSLRGRTHLVGATIVCNLFMVLSFLWIVACTVTHYPDLRTVPNWQHLLRTAFSKAIPGFVKKFANPTGQTCGDEQLERGVGVKCPAYLVCLNENTAGKSEQAAWIAVLASLVLLIPTVVNLSLLMRFHGFVGVWPFLNSLCVEVTCQIFILHYFSKDPSDRDALIRAAERRATMAERSGAVSCAALGNEHLLSSSPVHRTGRQGAERSPYPNLEASSESFIVYLENSGAPEAVPESRPASQATAPAALRQESQVPASLQLRPESQATTAVHSDSDRAAERRTIGHSSMSTIRHGESVGKPSKARESKDDYTMGNEEMNIATRDFADAA